MKKFLLGCVALFFSIFLVDYLYFGMGIYIPYSGDNLTVNAKNEGKTIYLKKDAEFVEFEIKGVDMGAGKSGHYATDLAITKGEYLRWFAQIQEMGANTVRVYTLLGEAFYKAVYEYNQNNPTPLYIIHGVWVDDYVLNSHMDAYAPEFINAFIEDCYTIVDVIHGKKKYYLADKQGGASYRIDISQWVIGYILGVEWEDATVAYTDHMQKDKNHYAGSYMQTTTEATPFEAMLAQVGDKMIAYETKRYGCQRLVAFSNWPTTDPFDYPENLARQFNKISSVNVEHIKLTEALESGTFASYHIYPYYPDYLNYDPNKAKYVDDTGKVNTYRAYLKNINDYHSIPVVISEFGVPSSRGMARDDANGNRNQGGISEKQQGQAIIDCYNDIKAAGCAGSVIFTWQDEWFKRTWNTMHYVDTQKTALWSDYQTNEQYFGLLSFDPGKEQSVCYVDGDASEWSEDDVLSKNGELTLSMKQDERFIYLLVKKEGLKESDKLYIPFDITPKTGAYSCENYNLTFTQPVDFVLAIAGRQNSRVVVQERYEALRAMFYHETDKLDAYENPPLVDTPIFKPISLVLQTADVLLENADPGTIGVVDTYETGLLTYGNANPKSSAFNSLADFCFGIDSVEIKLPWQLLNFSAPAEGLVHDDYYLHYGIENLKIKQIYAGVADESLKDQPIRMSALPLKRWEDRLEYHERLKDSYYMVQSVWREENP